MNRSLKKTKTHLNLQSPQGVNMLRIFIPLVIKGVNMLRIFKSKCYPKGVSMRRIVSQCDRINNSLNLSGGGGQHAPE